MRTMSASSDGSRAHRKIAAPAAPVSANSSAAKYHRRLGIGFPDLDVSGANIAGR